MQSVTTIGLRRYVLAFFQKLSRCLVGIEACASSHQKRVRRALRPGAGGQCQQRAPDASNHVAYPTLGRIIIGLSGREIRPLPISVRRRSMRSACPAHLIFYSILMFAVRTISPHFAISARWNVAN